MYIGVPATVPDCVHAGVIDGAGQAEVGDLDALDAIFQQDVRRLDVAMHQPLLVGGGQPFGDLHADAQDFLQGERPLLVDLVLQRNAVDDFHDEVRRLGVILDAVNRHDVFVLDGGGRAGFADEAIAR